MSVEKIKDDRDAIASKTIQEDCINRTRAEKACDGRMTQFGYKHSAYGVFSNPVSQPAEDKFVRKEMVRNAYKAVLQGLLESLATATPKSMKI